MKVSILSMFVAMLFLLTPEIQAVEDGAINVQIPAGSSNVYLRTNFNEGNVLLQSLEVFNQPNVIGNNPFDFISTFIVPQSGSQFSIHGMNDDACPRRYNGVILGGNHGLSAIRIKSSNHGLGQEYIGTKWKINPDATTYNYNFYIIRVVDDGNSETGNDYIWLLSQNIGTDENKWKFSYPTLTSTHELVYDDLINHSELDPGVTIGIESATNQSLFPVIKNRNVSLNINGVKYTTAPINDVNQTVYREVSIVEEYDIINPVSSLQYYIENVGTQELFNIGESQIRIKNTFIFDKWGGCTVEASSENLSPIIENGWGVIQSSSLYNNGSFDNQYYYMPNVKDITIGSNNQVWKMNEIADFSIAPDGDYIRYLEGIDATQSTWEDFEIPPYRSIQFLGDTKDDLEVGYQIAYDTSFGSAIPEVRKDNIQYNAWSGAFCISTNKKSYPYLFDYPPVPTDIYKARAFRGYFDPKKYSENATSVQFFKYYDEDDNLEKYRLFVDYHQSVASDIVALPGELTGCKITTIETQGVALADLFVTPEGLNFAVDLDGADYAYGVYDLEFNPYTNLISQNARNCILEDNLDGTYKLFVYYDELTDQLEKEILNLPDKVDYLKVNSTPSSIDLLEEIDYVTPAGIFCEVPNSTTYGVFDLVPYENLAEIDYYPTNFDESVNTYTITVSYPNQTILLDKIKVWKQLKGFRVIPNDDNIKLYSTFVSPLGIYCGVDYDASVGSTITATFTLLKECYKTDDNYLGNKSSIIAQSDYAKNLIIEEISQDPVQYRMYIYYDKPIGMDIIKFPSFLKKDDFYKISFVGNTAFNIDLTTEPWYDQLLVKDNKSHHVTLADFHATGANTGYYFQGDSLFLASYGVNEDAIPANGALGCAYAVIDITKEAPSGTGTLSLIVNNCDVDADDSNPDAGTEELPFKSIQGAINRIQQQIRNYSKFIVTVKNGGVPYGLIPELNVEHHKEIETINGEDVEVTYYDKVVNIDKLRNVTIQGENPADPPIIDGSILDYKGCRFGVYIRRSSNITIQDIEIKEVKQYDTTAYARSDALIVIDSPYCTFLNLKLHHCGGMGLILSGYCEGTLIKNCDAYYNYDPYTDGKRGDAADGFRYSPSESSVTGQGVKFIGCRAWKNSDDGWDLFGTEHQVIIENCWAFKNGYDQINDPSTFSGDGSGFKLGPNTYWHPEDHWLPYDVDGNGIIIWDEDTNGDGILEYEYIIDEDYSDNIPSHIVRDCIAIGNVVGFNSNNSFRKQYWYNNLAFRNIGKNSSLADVEKNYVIYRQNDPAVEAPELYTSLVDWNESNNQFVLRNNINVRNNTYLNYNRFDLCDNSNNSWEGETIPYTELATDEDFADLDFNEDISVCLTQLEQAERNSDGSLPQLDFLNLVYDSDLIDRGVTDIEITDNELTDIIVEKGFFGYHPDLGCYENFNVNRVNVVEELSQELIINDGEYLISDGGTLNCHENSKITVKDGGVLQATGATINGEELWQGIYAEDGSTVRLNSTDITNAECALSGVHIGGYVVDSEISDCINGIDIMYCDHFMINGNSITGNNTAESIGVLLTQYSTANTEEFDGNTISNFDTGVSIISCSPELIDNTIEENTSCGIFISGYNTFPVLKDYESVENDRNNEIRNNGVAQIGMKYAAGAYMDEGWNNIYSGATPCVPSVPCLLGISEYSKALLPISVWIQASENYWGYDGDIDENNFTSFFDLYYKYNLDYTDYANEPYSEQSSKGENTVNKSIPKELLAEVIRLRNDGKIKQAIDVIEKLLKKHPDSSEYYVALYMLPGLCEEIGMSLSNFLNFLDEKLKSDDETINKKYHKEMKVYVKMLDEKYDEAIKISEEMKAEASSESEIILAEIDIAIAKLMKGGQKDRKGTEVIRNLILQLMGYEKSTSDIDPLIPNKIKLHQNYPNPFNPVTQIKYDIAETSDVKLNIYNTNGQLVANLIDGKVNPGFHTVNFDASKLNSGVYIYTLHVGNKAFSKKMVLIK